jgi:cyanate lyase
MAFEQVAVSADALKTVLEALNGPDHLIRELQATRNLDGLAGEPNPINLLITQYNEQVEAYNVANGISEES